MSRFDEILEWAKAYSNSMPYLKLNSDEDLVRRLIYGLVKREEKFGKPYCPCRILSGKQKEDEKKICPCVWHINEIKKQGKCHCGLFVSDSF